MKKIALPFFLCVLIFVTSFAHAQKVELITTNSIGPIKLGMTVAEVRKAIRPMQLIRTGDGEVDTLLAVVKGKETVMVLAASPDDHPEKINEKAKIFNISVYSPHYQNAEKVHPGMLLSTLEKKYGKVTITLSEIESRESASFQNSGLEVNIPPGSGIFPKNSMTTHKYKPNTTVVSMEIADMRFFSHGP